MDIDLIQYCPKCYGVQLVCEVKTTDVEVRDWSFTRKIGIRLGAYAALVIERGDSKDMGFVDVSMVSPSDWDIPAPVRYSEAEFLAVLRRIRDEHICRS